jgi:hypothetical protein
MFSGWAVSRDGIASADLWFNNRRYRHRAELVADTSLKDRCPGVPNVGRARFVALFKARPETIRRVTDVQVEITDKKGVKHVLDDRWITWE